MKYFQILRLYAKRCSLLIISFIIIEVNAQNNTCPLNLDFEMGDFTNWKCLEGYVKSNEISPSVWMNIPDLSPSLPNHNRHRLIPGNNNESDPFGMFPRSSPNGSKYCLMLGNSSVGREAESVAYTFTLPATATQFSLTYYYAIVLENPGHLPHEQPRFRARVTDVNTGSEINCVSFDFVSSSELTGFKISPINGNVVYKDWTTITINLGEYAGKTLKLEFITSDCTLGAHFGYAYVDVSSNCNNSLVGASLCEGDNFLSLTAPDGFKSYHWFLNNNYSTVVSTSRIYSINPVPPTANAYSLIVTPYEGFGCVDTFTAPVKWQPKPAFTAGPDRQIPCTGTSVQLGTAPNPNYSYSWTPADKLSGRTAPNPWTNNYIYSPVNYIVKIIDNTTGCVSVDSALITPINCFLFMPTAFTPNGDGLNDKLMPYLGGTRGLRRFSIFNRNGNMVFTTTREGEGWDGNYKGVKLDPAVFVWILEYLSKDEQVVLEKGTVVLIK